MVPLQAGVILTVGHNGISVGQVRPRETEITRNSDRLHTAGRGANSQNGPERDSHSRAAGSRSRDPLELKDIFIAVKTTRKYHKSRLELLFQTWMSRAKEQVGGAY